MEFNMKRWTQRLALGALMLIPLGVCAQETEADEPELDAVALAANNNNPITARRRALRLDLNTLIDRLPENLDGLVAVMLETDKQRLGAQGIEELKSTYKTTRNEALQMRETVSRKMRGSVLDGLEARFPKMRDELFSCIYQLESSRHFGDPERFKAALQKKIDAQSAIDMEQKKRITAARRAKLAAWEKELGGTPSPTRLSEIYDNVGARQVDMRQAVITTEFNSNTQAAAFVNGATITQFKPKPKAQYNAVPPSVATKAYYPTFSNLSEAPANTSFVGNLIGASKSLLSDFIADVRSFGRKVSSTVENYSDRIASTIMDWSEKRGINSLFTAALVKTESSFNETIGSWAACVGLGQLSEGVARKYGLVVDHKRGIDERKNADKNLKATTGFLNELLTQFATKDERRYTEGLYAASTMRVKTAVKGGANKERAIADEFRTLWPKVPAGMKSAVAAYNAGPGAIQKYGSYDRLPLPARGLRVGDAGADEYCAQRAKTVKQDSSYCQTKGHVRSVYRNFLQLQVDATPGTPIQFADASQGQPNTALATTAYNPVL